MVKAGWKILPWGSRYLWPVRKPESENTSFTRSQSKCPKANPCCLMAVKVCMDVREESGETLSPCQVKGGLWAHRANVTAQQHCLILSAKFHEAEPKAAPDSPWRWTRSHSMWQPLVHMEIPCNGAGAVTLAHWGPPDHFFWSHHQTSWGKEGHHRDMPAATTALPGQIHTDASEATWGPKERHLLLALTQKGWDDYLTHTIGEEAMRWFVRGFPWAHTPQASFPTVSGWWAPTCLQDPCKPGTLHHHPKHHMLCRHSTSSCHKKPRTDEKP